MRNFNSNLDISFSILICTYNRHELLAKVLYSLIEGSDECPDQIVVVNGGDERADEVINSFMGRQGINLKLVKTVNKNLATSRNVGLLHCTGDIIAMTDDDAEVFPDWLSAMKEAHTKYPQAGAVGGVVYGTDSESFVSQIADAITFPSWDSAKKVRTLPGVNISYKREFVEKVGCQDETLFRGEDVDYNWRVQLAGGEIWFEPTIKVWHHHRSSLRGLINQQYMYGRAYFLVRQKWKDMYCIYPHHLHSFKDVGKLINFFISLGYVPIIDAQKLNKSKRMLAIPILFVIGFFWRMGIIDQWLREMIWFGRRG